MAQRIQVATGMFVRHLRVRVRWVWIWTSSLQFEYGSSTFSILFIFLQIGLTGNFENWSNRFAEMEPCMAASDSNSIRYNTSFTPNTRYWFSDPSMFGLSPSELFFHEEQNCQHVQGLKGFQSAMLWLACCPRNGNLLREDTHPIRFHQNSKTKTLFWIMINLTRARHYHVPLSTRLLSRTSQKRSISHIRCKNPIS